MHVNAEPSATVADVPGQAGNRWIALAILTSARVGMGKELRALSLAAFPWGGMRRNVDAGMATIQPA